MPPGPVEVAAHGVDEGVGAIRPATPGAQGDGLDETSPLDSEPTAGTLGVEDRGIARRARRRLLRGADVERRAKPGHGVDQTRAEVLDEPEVGGHELAFGEVRGSTASRVVAEEVVQADPATAVELHEMRPGELVDDRGRARVVGVEQGSARRGTQACQRLVADEPERPERRRAESLLGPGEERRDRLGLVHIEQLEAEAPLELVRQLGE